MWAPQGEGTGARIHPHQCQDGKKGVREKPEVPAQRYLVQRGETVLVAEVGADAARQELPDCRETGFRNEGLASNLGGSHRCKTQRRAGLGLPHAVAIFPDAGTELPAVFWGSLEATLGFLAQLEPPDCLIWRV